jgi:hypothetical protein
VENDETEKAASKEKRSSGSDRLDMSRLWRRQCSVESFLLLQETLSACA